MAPFNIFLGSLSFACFLLGTPGNILALVYYWTRPRPRLSNYLYGLVCLVDAFICLLSLAVGLSGMTNNSSMLYKFKAVCTLWAVAWFVADRMAVFVLVVFSVTRTLTLCFPFLRIRLHKVLIAIGFYTAVSWANITNSSRTKRIMNADQVF